MCNDLLSIVSSEKQVLVLILLKKWYRYIPNFLAYFVINPKKRDACPMN